MKKPRIASHRRPPGVSRRTPRTRAEAAVDLVRLEFDSERLERELEQLDRRAQIARRALVAGQQRARTLIQRLSSTTTRKDAP